VLCNLWFVCAPLHVFAMGVKIGLIGGCCRFSGRKLSFSRADTVVFAGGYCHLSGRMLSFSGADIVILAGGCCRFRGRVLSS